MTYFGVFLDDEMPMIKLEMDKITMMNEMDKMTMMKEDMDEMTTTKKTEDLPDWLEAFNNQETTKKPIDWFASWNPSTTTDNPFKYKIDSGRDSFRSGYDFVIDKNFHDDLMEKTRSLSQQKVFHDFLNFTLKKLL